MENIAVITSDIVGFTRMSMKKRAACLDDVKRCFEYLKESRKKISLVGNPEISRGDSFQLVLADPKKALEVALLIKTFFVFDIKISIGIGGSSQLRKKTGESEGEAFTFSGRTLDELKHTSISLAIKTKKEDVNDEMETHCYMLEAFASRWTIAQRDVIFYKLIEYTEFDIAKVLGISQPTVNVHSRTANWKAVERFLNRFENIMTTKI